MKFGFVASLVSALALGVSAQDTNAYAAQLLQALQAANLTTLASLATTNAATLVPLLQSGNHTVFAPSDAAFAALPENVTSNNDLVANTLLYHILSGSYAPSNLSANHTVARTSLNSSEYVNLPSNASQVIVLTSGGSGNSSEEDNGSGSSNGTQSATVIQATSNVTSTAYTKVANLDIYIIDEVLSIPQNVTSTAAAAGLTGLTGALTQYAPTAIEAIDSARGITVFAPTNAAFEQASSLLGTLNETTIAGVLLNHIINGTVVYSPLVTNGLNATSAGGATLSFVTNSTGVFVMSGNSTAQIIRTDIPVENGVVHLISNVLANPESNPQAAESAAASASSVAATNTAPQTGGVTPTASGSNGQPTQGGGTSGAEKVVVGGLSGLIALGAVALF